VMGAVSESAFFQHDVDFMAIRRSGGINVYQFFLLKVGAADERKGVHKNAYVGQDYAEIRRSLL